MIEHNEAMREEPTIHGWNWQKVAAERDIPLIEAAIARLEARGLPTEGMIGLLLRVKRWLHLPYRDDI